MSSKALTRKRSRAQVQEEDELAPEQATAPLSSTKKRKLNADGLSPPIGDRFGSIKRSIGGLLGFGRTEKENLPQDGEQDELAEEDIDNDAADDQPAKDIWEVEDSEPEEATVKRRSSGRNTVEPTPKGTKAAQNGGAQPRNGRGKSGGKGDDIWEVPESPPRPSRSVSTAERAKALLAPPGEQSSPQPPKRTPGRPRKSDILKNAKKLSNQAIREKMMSAAGGGSEDEEEGDTATPTRRRRRKDHVEQDADAEPTPKSGKASVTKKRGRPAQVQTVEEKQAPKSILTPVKQRAGRGRKSVVFDAGDEVDLGFKDLPSSAATTKSNKFKKSILSPSVGLASKSSIKAVELNEDSGECSQEEEAAEEEMEEAEMEEEADEEEESDDVDDEMCEICSGLESTRKNPILFCDGKDCKFAVHKECYSVARVPRGDWFCRDCEPEDEEIPTKELEAVVPPVEGFNIPAIEGFDDHLRHVQRIVLDKLTGQRRTRLRGHEEEMQKVHQVVEQTVLAGEGNSMLVIGARGCGKTTVCLLWYRFSGLANVFLARGVRHLRSWKRTQRQLPCCSIEWLHPY